MSIRRILTAMAIAAIVVALPVNADVIKKSATTKGGADDHALRSYYSGNGLLNRGLHDLAAEEYASFLDEHAEHAKAPLARYGLAVCHFRSHRFPDAIRELKRLHQLPDHTYAAEVGVMLGQSYLATGRLETALEVFGQVVSREPAHELADDAAVGAIEAAYRLQRAKEGLKLCKGMARKWPDSPLRDRSDFFCGLLAIGDEQHELAAQRFRTLLKRSPESPFAAEAALLMAQCHQQLDGFEKAARLYRKVIAGAKSNLVPDALYGLATVLYRAGELNEAAALLDRVLKEFPTCPAVPSAGFQRARIRFDLGDIERARAGFESMKDEEGDVRDTEYWLAKCDLRQGRLDAAADRLRRAIASQPASRLLAEMNYDLAIALIRNGRQEAGLDILNRFRSAFPGHRLICDAIYLAATAEHDLAHYDQSRTSCETYLTECKGSGHRAKVRVLNAENLFLAGDYEGAIKAYHRVLAGEPDTDQAVVARFRLGQAFHRLDRDDDALEWLLQVEGMTAESSILNPLRLSLGDIYFDRSEWKNAEKYLARFVAANGDAAGTDDAVIKLGIALQHQDRQAKAIEVFDHLIEMFDESPHRTQALFERGQALVALDRDEEATVVFQRVVQEGAGSRFEPYARTHLGALAMKRNDFDAAAAAFDAVDDAAGDVTADAMYRRGLALLAAESYAKAGQVFAKFSASFVNHKLVGAAAAYRAICASRQGKFADALARIKRLEQGKFTQLPGELQLSLRYEKAWCLRETGDMEPASEVYRSIIELAGQDTTGLHARLDLAAIEMEGERYDAAAGLLAELTRLIADPQRSVSTELAEQTMYRLAICEFQLEQYESAAKRFSGFVDRYGESGFIAPASYYCGEALAKLGRFDDAVTHLQRVVEDFPSDKLQGPSLLRLGDALSSLQRWPESERIFQRFIDDHEADPRWFQAMFGIAWAQEHQGRFGAAIKNYRDVTDRHKGPTAARAQFQIGECLFAEEDYRESVRELLKVDILYAYPEWSAAALYEAGRCFERMREAGEARKQFRAVAERFADTRWAKMASERLTRLTANAVPGR